MRVGMIGMGRMGAAMARRLIRAGHDVVAHDVLAAALLERFASRGERELADRVISAMRTAFGGHPEPPA